MAVTIKSPREIELMREAGRILAKTHEELAKNLRPGMSTWDIDHMGEEIIRSYGCIPSFKNYNGYPASICVSVNDEVVHGIPHKEHFLDEGDIVSLDAGVIYKAGTPRFSAPVQNPHIQTVIITKRAARLVARSQSRKQSLYFP